MLRVLNRRPDGFHRIETIFQSISLHDVMRFERSSEERLECDDPSIPVDGSNLVARALGQLRAERDVPPLSISIEKRIPAGGGLGGGSSNAATALRVINRMLDLRLDAPTLHRMAAALGSDVPFFLKAGTVWASGRGEELRAVPPRPGIPLIVVVPKEKISTAGLIALWDGEQEPDHGELGFDRCLQLMREGGLDQFSELTNDFETVAFERLPELRQHHQMLLDLGAGWARLSGSGSSIVGAFRSPAERDSALARFETRVTALPAETIDSA